MKTSKPFATISYNSEEFLTRKLNELVVKRAIEFWCYIDHYAEEDEAKDHKHLYIVPNGQVNTDQIDDYLIEPVKATDSNPNALPLRCIRFRSSKFADWYQYALHDSDYLASKGQARRHHYTIEDIKTSDNDYLLEEVHTIDYSVLNRSKALKDAVQNNGDLTTLLWNGQIPIQQINAYEKAFGLLQEHLNRNGRETHTPKLVDTRTGEVLQETEEDIRF